jgi:hypothetical protein
MLSQQLEDKSQHLETRVAALETELAQMRQMLSVFVQKKTPWWLKLLRWFKLKPKRKEFDLILGYDGFNKGDVLSNGFIEEMLILSKYERDTV